MEVNTIIITSVLDLERFFRAIIDKDGEPPEQLMRRCKTVMRLTQNEMYLYTYKDSKHDYVLVGSGKNPVADMYDTSIREMSEDELKDLCNTMGIVYSSAESSDDDTSAQETPAPATIAKKQEEKKSTVDVKPVSTVNASASCVTDISDDDPDDDYIDPDLPF